MPHSTILLVHVSHPCSLHNGFTYTGRVIRCPQKGAAAQWIMRILLKIPNYVGSTWRSAIGLALCDDRARPPHRRHFQKLESSLSYDDEVLSIIGKNTAKLWRVSCLIPYRWSWEAQNSFRFCSSSASASASINLLMALSIIIWIS